MLALAGRRSGGNVWVATTRLALALAAGGAGQAKRDGNDGFIVVETNYRVSSLRVASCSRELLHAWRKNRAQARAWRTSQYAYRIAVQKDIPLQHLKACTILVWQRACYGRVALTVTMLMRKPLQYAHILLLSFRVVTRQEGRSQER